MSYADTEALIISSELSKHLNIVKDQWWLCH